MQKHRLEKIVVSVGLGKLHQNPQFEEKILPAIVSEVASITGQRPAPRGAKKAIATFKTRTGDVIGITVTLRGQRMRDFLARLVNVALPRVRDFRGIDTKSVDGRGNLTIGIREHTVFPEINQEISRVNFGFEVTFVLNTKTREDGIKFYRELGLPLKKV